MSKNNFFSLSKFFRTVDFPERNCHVNDILCHLSFLKNSISRNFLRGLEPNKACLSAGIVREIAVQPYLQFCIKYLLIWVVGQSWVISNLAPVRCACMLSHVRLCNPTDCSLPGFSVHGIFPARILEWVAISFSKIIMECFSNLHVLLVKGPCQSVTLGLEGQDVQPVEGCWWHIQKG